MRRGTGKKFLSAAVYGCLMYVCLQFAAWVSQMAFDNTCINLEKQYIQERVRDIIDTVENAVNFGKELNNYYGMDEVFASVRNISEENIEAAMLDADANPLYLSFEERQDKLERLSQILAEKNREALIQAAARGGFGESVALGDYDAMVFPVCKGQTETAGYFLVLYEESVLLEKNTYRPPGEMIWIIWSCAFTLLLVFLFHKKENEGKKGYLRHVPVLLIMSAILVYMFFMYQTYKQNYTVMVKQNAMSAAEYIKASIEELIQKGLSVENLDRLPEYWKQKEENNDAIESISIVKNNIKTRWEKEQMDNLLGCLELDGGKAFLKVVFGRSYIQKQLNIIGLIFGAVFIVCLMITYELIHFADVIAAGTDGTGREPMDIQRESMGVQIKLLSFLCYGAIYTSMSYTAVIMRGWNACLFGLSPAVTASLPLTVELLSILFCQIAAGKVFRGIKLNRLLALAFSFLILGNFACMFASSPGEMLFLRAICGMGFGYLKFCLNGIVSSASEDAKEVGRHYAQLNSGLLGGITVGASLGSILAQAMGYSFNYFFTGALCGFTAVFSMIFLPFSRLHRCWLRDTQTVQASGTGILDIVKKGMLRRAVLLGDIPLNVGLMYVVAFLPVYMDTVGQPAIATSYAYLANGLAGAYLGVGILGLLKNVSASIRAGTALLMGAAGILILAADSSIWILLLSAGIMGLFDGYGTPVITEFFAGLPQVQKADSASMLTVFNSVGGAVQVLCPVFYNMLILPDGNTKYLFLFGVAYLGIALLFLYTFKGKHGQAVSKRED